MAADGHEVEIKVPVSPDLFTKIAEELRSRLGAPNISTQLDRYFTPSDDDFTDEPFPYKWLSVRSRGTQASINFKHFWPEGAEWHTHADEIDVQVLSPEDAERLLAGLGFRTLVTVHKTRLALQDPAGFEVALDEVEGLGHFVEVEAIRDFGGIDATRQAVTEYASRLGLEPTSADPRGYPFRLLARQRESSTG